MNANDGWLASELRRRGVSRREFMGFCATMAAALSLPDECRGADRTRRSTHREAGAHLAGIPGLRREHRVVPEGQPSDGRRNRPRHAVGRLPRDDHGGRRPAGRREPGQHREAARGQLHRRRRGIDSDGRQRRATARSAGARRSTSPAKSAATRRRRSRSAPARPSAAFLRLRRIRRARSASPTRCRASRT